MVYFVAKVVPFVAKGGPVLLAKGGILLVAGIGILYLTIYIWVFKHKLVPIYLIHFIIPLFSKYYTIVVRV